MTDKYDERAAEIERAFLDGHPVLKTMTIRSFIAAALREAVEETLKNFKPAIDWTLLQAMVDKKAKADAYADAAMIVHKRWERLRLSPTILQVELLQLEQVEEDLRARAQEVQP